MVLRILDLRVRVPDGPASFKRIEICRHRRVDCDCLHFGVGNVVNFALLEISSLHLGVTVEAEWETLGFGP